MKKSTGSLQRLVTRIFNTPLLIDPAKAEVIISVLGPRIGFVMPSQAPQAFDMFDDEDDEKPEECAASPVFTLPIYGTLVKRAGMRALSGMTSYSMIKKELQAALADPNVKAVVLDIDSPGGEVDGMFDLAEFIVSVRDQKPIIACVNEMACSAAYALASCAERILISRTGSAGSIGCYCIHCDVSKADEKIGLSYTYIYAGEKKVDGNPHEPLPEDVRKEMQAEVDMIRDMFVALVSKNRSVSADEVYETEAGVFMGMNAIPLLVDQIGNLEDARALALEIAEKRTARVAPAGELEEVNQEGTRMDAPDNTPLADRVILVESFTEFMRNGNIAAFDLVMTGRQMEVPLSFRRYGTAALSGEKKARVSGLLAPYGSLSADLGGFRERYEPGCFKESLDSDDEMMVLGFHNPEHVLGRRSNSTARFWEERDGVHYEADLPATSAGNDIRTLLERGDVRESSAAFYILRHRWELTSAGRVRVIEKARLVEGSPHSFAAYKGSTSIVTAEDAQQEPAATVDLHELELLGARLQLIKA